MPGSSIVAASVNRRSNQELGAQQLKNAESTLKDRGVKQKKTNKLGDMMPRIGAIAGGIVGGPAGAAAGASVGGEIGALGGGKYARQDGRSISNITQMGSQGLGTGGGQTADNSFASTANSGNTSGLVSSPPENPATSSIDQNSLMGLLMRLFQGGGGTAGAAGAGSAGSALPVMGAGSVML
jgi:hypothetical protein